MFVTTEATEKQLLRKPGNQEEVGNDSLGFLASLEIPASR
jgi:hypothetical protein